MRNSNTDPLKRVSDLVAAGRPLSAAIEQVRREIDAASQPTSKRDVPPMPSAEVVYRDRKEARLARLREPFAAYESE